MIFFFIFNKIFSQTKALHFCFFLLSCFAKTNYSFILIVYQFHQISCSKIKHGQILHCLQMNDSVKIMKNQRTQKTKNQNNQQNKSNA